MLFKKFDTDGDGQIDSSELKSGLLSLNLADLPPSQVDRLIETIDADGDGRLDLHELHTTITGEDLPDAASEDSEGSEEEPVEEDTNASAD
ncbi:MAG TPA: EF-hand domain-containing protein, partial [Candidatus Poseidoniales archaeon]